MKAQILLPLIAILAPLASAVPTAEPEPALAPIPFNFTASLLAALPDFGRDDEETPANIADDELAEDELTLGPSSSDLAADSDRDDDLLKRAPAPVPSLTWEHKYNFKRRLRQIARGDSTITFWKDGRVRFRTQFRALRVFSYNYSVGCVLRDARGNVFTLVRKGRICGILTTCASSHAVDDTVQKPLVARNWQNIKKGNKLAHCKATLKWDAPTWIRKVIDGWRRSGLFIGAIVSIFPW